MEDFMSFFTMEKISEIAIFFVILHRKTEEGL